MKKLLYTFFIFNVFFVSFGQSLKEDYKECSLQKFYIGDFKGSIECLSKLIEIDPKDSSQYNNRGLIKEIIHDYIGAEKDFTKQLEIDSTLADSYFFRAMIKDKLKDIKGAISDYKMTVKYEPDNSDGYYFMGLNQFTLGELKNAEFNYKKALAKRKDNYTVYADIGLIKAQSKNYLEALKYCEKAISLDKKCEKVYYYEGWINAQQKKNKEAILDFKNAIDLNPNYDDQLVYGNLKRNYKDFKASLAEFNKEDIKKETDSSYYKKGLLNLYLKDYKNAILNFNKSISKKTDLYIVYLYRSKAKAALNDNNGAINDLNIYIVQEPKNEKAYYFLSSLQLKIKQYDEAILSLSKAISLNEYSAEYYLERGEIELKYSNKLQGFKDINECKQLGRVSRLHILKPNCK